MENLKCVLILSILTLIFSFTVASSGDKKPPSKKILEGNDLLIVCNATEEVNSTIYWTKNFTRSTFYREGRKMEIININKMDAGDYVCHKYTFNTSLPDGNHTETNVTVEVINIDVQYPAMVPYFYMSPLEPTENQTFMIDCGIMGNPYPTWTIRNRDTGYRLISATLPANTSIGPNQAFCYQTGFWECTGHNHLNRGVNATKGAQLNVRCSPKPDPFENPQTLVNSRIGGDASFYLKFNGYPKPTVTWSRTDGKLIRGDVTTNTEGQGWTSLNISDVRIEDYGNYTLSMYNSIGSYHVNYQLITRGAPQTPTNLQFYDVKDHSVTLYWTSGYDMGSQQYFLVMKLIDNQFIQISDVIYDNSTNHGVGNRWKYTQTGLLSDTYYKLTVVARNQESMSGFATPSAGFFTSYDPVYPSGKHSGPDKITITIVVTVGYLSFVVVLAGVVYFVKYRKMKTSYINI